MNLYHSIRLFIIFYVFISPVYLLAQKPEIVVNTRHSDLISSLDISNNERFVVSGSRDNTIKLWERESGRLIRTMYHGTNEVYMVFFTNDDSQIISCGGNDSVRVWKTETGELVRQFKCQVDYIESVSKSEDRTKIIGSDEYDTIRIYDVATGCIEHVFNIPQELDTILMRSEDGDEYIEQVVSSGPQIINLALSPDNSLFYAATSFYIHIWDLNSGKKIRILSPGGKEYDRNGRNVLLFMAFDSNMQKIQAISWDSIFEWNIMTGYKTSKPIFETFLSRPTNAIFDTKTDMLYYNRGIAAILDLNTGKPVKQIVEPITAMALSKNGDYLITGCWDRSIKQWDLTGNDKIIRHIDSNLYERRIKDMVMSADGGNIIIVQKGSVLFIDRISGKEVTRLYDENIDIIACSSIDKNTVVSIGNDSLLIFWDISKNVIKKKMVLPGKATSLDYDPVKSMLFIGDRKGFIHKVEIKNGDIKSIKAHDFTISQIIRNSKTEYLASLDVNGVIKLSSDDRSKVPHTFQYSPNTKYIDISINGKYLLAATDTSYTIWDIPSKRVLKSMHDAEDRLNNISFGITDNQILVNKNYRIQCINFRSDKILNTNYINRENVISMVIDPDKHFVYSVTIDGSLYQWDLDRLVYQSTFGADLCVDIGRFCLNSDNSYLVTVDYDDNIRSWNIKRNEKIDIYNPFNTGDQTIIDEFTSGYQKGIMGDSSCLIIGSNGKYYFKYNYIGNLETILFNEFNIQLENTDMIAVSDNAEYLAISAKEIIYKEKDENKTLSGGNIVVFDVVSEKPVWIFKGSLEPRVLKFSPDNKYLISGAFNFKGPYPVKVWDMETGQLRFSLSEHQDEVNAMAITSDSKYLFTGSFDNTIIIWNLETGELINTLTNHAGQVISLQITKDEKLLFSGSSDRTIKIWQLPEGDEIATISIIDSTDWLVITPDGLFDATPAGMKIVHYVKGTEIIELDQMKDRFYEPGLLQKLIGFNEEGLRDASNLQQIDLYPKIELGEINKDGDFLIELTNQGGGIGKVKVLINGKEIADDVRGLNPDVTAQELFIMQNIKDHPFLIPNSNNIIEVKAYNAEGYLVSRGAQIKYNPKSASQATIPSLYIISIGISDYTGDGIDLKYAAKDAQDMAKSLEIGSKRLFGTEKTFVYLLNSDKFSVSGQNLPTKAKIIKSFEEVAQKAKSTDILVVYFSGHGINWGGDNGDFYYLTQEAYSADPSAYNDPAIRSNTTLSSEELVSLINEIPALKQVLIIDACASGRVVENLMAQRQISSNTLRALDRLKDRTGMHIITGCTADAVSYEASSFGQGLLTYSLIEGMKGKALREEHFVDINLLFQNARERVPQLAKGIGGIQSPEVFSPYGAESFDIGELSDEDKQSIPLAKVKPVFVRSSFQDEEEMIDILELSKKMDEKLDEISQVLNSKIIFIDVREFPEASKLIGRYTRENGEITLHFKIKTGEEIVTHEVKATSPEAIVDEVLNLIETAK